MTRSLAQSLDSLIESRGAQVVFLCAEVRDAPTFDKAAAELVMAQMRRTGEVMLLPNIYLSPAELMSLIACCTLTLSMRYHFCLFSALQSVPFIAIRRSDKISDLCEDLGWKANVEPPGFTVQEIVSHAEQLDADRGRNAAGLRQAIATLRDRARLNLTGFDIVARARP
jgi:polysaccharide pyruvyl transferase WcaK-like protein